MDIDQKVAHTPGPWHIAQGTDARDFIVAEASGNTICEPNIDCFDFAELDPNVRTIPLAEAKANAKLLAAAPELLAVCRRFLEMYDSVRDSVGPSVKAAIEHAERAIAKAEGR